MRRTRRFESSEHHAASIERAVGAAPASRWAAGFALIGSAIAPAAPLALGASSSDITSGPFGFSAVLTAIALGSVFYTPSWRVLGYAVLATMFTVIVQGAMDSFLAPVGVPTFTAPFVFTTWLLLLPTGSWCPSSTKTSNGAPSAPAPRRRTRDERRVRRTSNHRTTQETTMLAQTVNSGDTALNSPPVIDPGSPPRSRQTADPRRV